MQQEQRKRSSVWGILYCVLALVAGYNVLQQQQTAPVSIINWLPPFIFVVLGVREFLPAWRRPLTLIAWLLIVFVLVYLLYDSFQ